MPNNQERYFISYAPSPKSKFWALGASWFAYDAASNTIPPSTLTLGIPPELHMQTIAPARRTGFNAIFIAPFKLNDNTNEEELTESVRSFCKSFQPFRTCVMKVKSTGNKIGIEPLSEDPQISNLANDSVHHFNKYRDISQAVTITQPMRDILSEQQLDNLVKWGHPYYFDEYKFHIPLTGRIPSAMTQMMTKKLQAQFSQYLSQGLLIEGLSLFKQSNIKEPAQLIKCFEFGMKELAEAVSI